VRRLVPGVVLGLIAIVMLPILAGCGSTSAAAEPAGGGSSTEVSTTTSPAGGSPSTTEAVPTVVRIGALFPLSGDLATEGQDCLNGMRLAAGQINAAGGIKSLNGATIDILQADTGGDSANVGGRMTSLDSQGVAAVVGTYQSSVALEASKLAESLEMPLVISVAAADEVTEQQRSFTFRICPKDEWYARDQVRYLDCLDTQPGVASITKVVLLHENGEFGEQVAADQRKYLEDAKIEVVDEIAYPADQANFDEVMLRIMEGSGQAVLTATYLDDAVLIAESAAKLHLAIPIIDAGGGTTDRAFVTRAGAAANGVITELEYGAGDAVTQLEADYLEAYGKSLTPGALYSYQAVWLLADALERSGTTESDALRLALADTAMNCFDHLVLPQVVLSFDDDGQNRAAALLLVRIEGSRFVPVWPVAYAQSQ
jgi:branched-chain amino acid transport system substrate-binding protein